MRQTGLSRPNSQYRRDRIPTSASCSAGGHRIRSTWYEATPKAGLVLPAPRSASCASAWTPFTRRGGHARESGIPAYSTCLRSDEARRGLRAYGALRRAGRVRPEGRGSIRHVSGSFSRSATRARGSSGQKLSAGMCSTAGQGSRRRGNLLRLSRPLPRQGDILGLRGAHEVGPGDAMTPARQVVAPASK